MRLPRVIILVLLVWLAVVAGADEAYRLCPGDKLELIIMTLPGIEKQYVIRSDGGFYHQELGEMQAAGKTVRELHQEIETKLVHRLKKPDFKLGLVERGRKEIAVLGEVKKPGKFMLEAGSTVLDAVAQAEGLTDRADPDWGVIYRNGSAVRVSLRPPPPGSLELSQSLEVGDVLYVLPGARVSITGEVQSPGVHSVPRGGSDARTALERAGGLKPEAAMTRVLLIRPTLVKPVVVDVTPGEPLVPEAREIKEGDALLVPARQAVVLGAVNKAVPLKGGENLLDVYLATGGPVQYNPSPLNAITPTYTAANSGGGNAYLDDIKIIRAADRAKGINKAESVNLEAYMEDGDPKALVPIYDGDVIFIPAANPSNFNLFTLLSVIGLIRGLGGL